MECEKPGPRLPQPSLSLASPMRGSQPWPLLGHCFFVPFRELTKVILGVFNETKPEPVIPSLLFLPLNLVLFFALNLKSNIISIAVDLSQC